MIDDEARVGMLLAGKQIGAGNSWHRPPRRVKT